MKKLTKAQNAALKAAKEEQPLTIEQRIEQLKTQQEQAKEVFIKCGGAIEVLEQMKKEQS